MKRRNVGIMAGALAFFLFLTHTSAWSQGFYSFTWDTYKNTKAFYDDPRPLFKDAPISKTLPPHIYEKLIFDRDAMSDKWEEVVGFKAPDVVGKIAPDIKPGTYTYKDKEAHGFKELMIPEMYNRFNPSDPPFVGNFPEITVIPTQQRYHSLPVAEASLTYMGKTQQDEQGYMNYETYEAGVPFPRPSGKHKAQQIMYNWEKRYGAGENMLILSQIKGFQHQQKEDFYSIQDNVALRLEGRVVMEPFGWYDERARANGEGRGQVGRPYSPRDLYGNVFSVIFYEDPNKPHMTMLYLSMMRRVRKMSGTDTQDPMGGQDFIFDDGDGFFQKLSPTRYPYKYEVLEEREYLVPAYTTEGAYTIGSESRDLMELEFERRPVYVLKLTQLDKSYIYSYRIMYFDKENFLLLFTENYDEKGRLYRTTCVTRYHEPDMGGHFMALLQGRDHVDHHTTIQMGYTIPTPEITRADIDLRTILFKAVR